MRKSNLNTGEPFFEIKIAHFVKDNDFAKHLAEHFWLDNTEFDINITRSEAMAILKKGLFFHGLYGEVDFTMYEGADASVIDPYNLAYKAALNWVHKKYPYLINQSAR